MSEKNNINDVLTEIPEEEWPALRDLFKAKWPKDLLAFIQIESQIDLKKRNALPDLKIYSLNNDWSDGTFILKESDTRNIYTLQENGDRLKRAMLLDDWSDLPKLHPYHEKHKDIVEVVFEKLGFDALYYDVTTMWWIPKEKALNLEVNIPDDLYVAPLKPEHAAYMNSLWPHRWPGSEDYLRQLVTTNISLGLYGKERNDLRTWILRTNNGIVGKLHTHPDHFRKGYAFILLKAMTKTIAEAGWETVACIVDGNSPSVNLFQKTGFLQLGKCWYTRPTPGK